MDSNLNRLYYMLNNDGRSDGNYASERTVNSESKKLLNSVSNDLSTLNTYNDSFNNSTAATLDISSTTIINQINNNIIARGYDSTGERNSNSSEIQMEYHFNPLYIISDQNGAHQELNHQNSQTSSSILDHHMEHFHELVSPPPSDPYGLIYMALVLAGIGFLLPYNSFMITVDYFQQRFPGTIIVFDMSTTYILFAFITVIIQNFFVETIPFIWRLNLGYMLSFIFMIFIVIYEIWARLGSPFDNLLVISIIAVGCTIQQSTFYGYTSMLPKRYIQAVMTGESAAGIFVSTNRIVTKILYPRDPEYNTILFFSISIVVILACAIVHIFLLPRSDFIRYHIFLCHNQNKSENNDGSAHIMHQINENVGLVNMYHNKDNSAEQRNSIHSNLISTTKICNQKSTIFSTEFNQTSDNLDMIANSTSTIVHRTGTLQSKVQNMLRTDSTEFVLPFGIDDEEILSENSQQQTNRPLTDDLFDSNNNTEQNDNENSSDYCSISFKSPTTTSFMLRWLHPLETLTHLYFLQQIFHRLRKCDKSFTQFMIMMHKKYFIRKNIVYCIWPYIVSIIMVYFVTMTIFPSIELEIYSCRFDDWFPIILMATFNLTDFIGKLMSTLFYRINRIHLLLISMLRFLLIPLFSLSITPRKNPFFSNPCWPILFSIILGLSNGIFGSLPMVLAPFKVNEQMREITGNLMTFSYIIGLTSGSFASYVLNNWTTTTTTTTTTTIAANMTNGDEYLYYNLHHCSMMMSSNNNNSTSPINLTIAQQNL